MKSGGKIKRNSLYQKLFTSFLVLMLPILCSGYVLYSWGKNTMQSEIEDSARENVSFLQRSFDTKVQNLDKQLNHLLTDEDSIFMQFYVNRYSYTTVDYWLTLRDIIAKLTIVQNSDDLIEDVIVSYPTLGISISSNAGMHDIDEKHLKADETAYYRQSTSLTDSNSVLFVGKMFPLSRETNIVKNESQPVIFIQAILSQNAIQEYISAYSTYSGYQTALVNRNSGNIIIDAISEKKRVQPSSFRFLLENKAPRKGYLQVTSRSFYPGYTFVQLLPYKDLFVTPNRFSIFFAVYLLISILILFLYSVSIQKYVKYPINKLMNAFQELRNGNFGFQAKLDKPPIELSYLFNGFNELSTRLGDLINRVYKQELYTREIEFKQLQSQINPHFLFNSFYTLRHLIEDEDIDTASRMADYLGDYYQYITKTDQNAVSLYEEYGNAKAYLQIQQLRFEDQLIVRLDTLPTRAANIVVPKMILQPILENTMEHGIKRKQGSGIVQLHFCETENDLHILIEDNGEMLKDTDLQLLQEQLSGEKPIKETTALFNIDKRLKLAFGEGYGLTASRSSLGGLFIDMKIAARPWLKDEFDKIEG